MLKRHLRIAWIVGGFLVADLSLAGGSGETAFHTKARALALDSPSAEQSFVRVFSAGADSRRPARVGPGEIDSALSSHIQGQSIDTADAFVMRKIGELLAGLNLSEADRTPERLDLRFKMEAYIRGEKVIGFYATTDGFLLFEGRVLRSDSKGWLRILWDLASARDIYTPPE